MNYKSFVFWVTMVFIVPLAAAIGAGTAVAASSNARAGRVVGIIVFSMLMSLVGVWYRAVRARGPSKWDIAEYHRRRDENFARAESAAAQDLGFDNDLATLYAHAVLPPIDEMQTAGSKDYHRAINDAAWNFVEKSDAAVKRDASQHDQETLALNALNRYAAIGRQHGDPQLPQRVDAIIRTYAER
ncbi:MAG: hypothetical protein ABFR53_12840 [Actinomycetota bacterium]